MRKAEFIFNTLTLPIDFVMLLLAGITTYVFRTKILSSFRPVLFTLDLPFEKYMFLVALLSLVLIGAFAISGLYSLRYRHGMFQEFLKIIVASSAGMMSLIIYIFIRQELFNSRFLVLGAWFFAIIFVSLGRLIMRQLQKFLVTKYNFGVHQVLVIGNDEISKKIVSEILSRPKSGYRLVKQAANPDIQDIQLLFGQNSIDEIILADPNFEPKLVREIVDFCHENHIIFKFVPNIYRTLTTNFSLDILNGIPLFELRRTALEGWGRVTKRFLDIIASLFFIIILLPIFLIIAIIIKIDSSGPVFVGLERISKNKKIKLIKFRSMINGAENMKQALLPFNERKDSPLFKLRDDPRVTRIGKYLRKYRIDEFPQFFNVLTGDLSVVGPRPHQPDEIQKYQKHHKRVLTIKAGATGLAQVSGSSDLPFEEEVSLDTNYIENWSLWWDVKIIAKTAIKIFNDRSV